MNATVSAIAKQSRFAVARGILNIGGMNNRMRQKTFGVDQDVPLLAADVLAGIIAFRVIIGPPFSPLFTLWLSMMHAVGLASRSTRSRHCT